jgi:ATP-dependent RNA helicase SrmB
MSLTIGNIIGGVDYQKDADLLAQNLDILVATPGRLMMYIEQEKFDPRQVEVLIIDEADRMLDMGFMPVVDRISAETRWRKQTMLFSATLEGQGLEGFVSEILENPAHCDAKPPRSERKKINQLYYRADDAQHKFKLLCHLLDEVERSIIFVRTRERAQMLHAQLQSQSIKAVMLQGEMAQIKRESALASFRQGKVNHLVATDVAARGLDIPDISHVFNYDMPRTADVYLHRIGRTGRAGAKGIAIALVEAHDHPMLERVQRYTSEGIRKRVVEALRPKSKAPKFSSKKKKVKTTKKGAKSKPKKGKSSKQQTKLKTGKPEK